MTENQVSHQRSSELNALLGGKAEAPQGQASSLHLIANLITCGLGTGIFTLPWSTAGASVGPALIIIAAVLLLNAWTISILVEAGERHKTFDLGSLLGRLPGQLGPIAQMVCNVFLWISTFLCLTSYIIVIVDCIHSSLPAEYSDYHRSTMALFAAGCVLPLCFLDQRQLSATSSVAVLATANIFALIASQFAQAELHNTRQPACYFGLSMGSIAMVSAMMQTVIIQVCILPMYAELKDRTPTKFNFIVAISFSALFIICAGFAVVGYLTYGETVAPDVLTNLPGSPWGTFSRLSAAAAVCAVYPIIMNPMLAPLWNANANVLQYLSYTGLSHKALMIATTCGVVAASSVAAMFINDLGAVNVENGALSAGVFVALSPSLIGLYLCGAKSNNTLWRMTMFLLAFTGVAFSALGAVITDNYTAVLHASCMWKHSAT